jgi:hypothetical protein
MPKVSKEASKSLMDLQTAVNANDAAGIPGKVAAAQAAAKTADDRYVIGLLQLKAAAAARNNAGIASSIEAMLASGGVAQNEMYSLNLALAQAYANLSQNDKSAAAYQRAAQLNPTSVEAMAGAAETTAAAGHPEQALALLQKGIAMQQSGGQKAPEKWYKRAVAIAYEGKLASSVDISRQWVAAYPSQESWQNTFAIYRNIQHPDAKTEFDLFRLARITDSLGGTGDYRNYASVAVDEANIGEAKAVIAEGLASGKIKASDPVVQEIQGVLRAKATPTAADLATSEKGAREPIAFLRVGDRYYGAGNYAKAADLYRQAMAKGVDKNLASLRIGEALARSGDKAGATAAFNAVTGPLADVAKFWLIYVQRQA